MQTATLSDKYQICIPKSVREQMGLQAGQQFIFIAKNGVLRLVPKRESQSLKGSLTGSDCNDYRDRKDRT